MQSLKSIPQSRLHVFLSTFLSCPASCCDAHGWQGLGLESRSSQQLFFLPPCCTSEDAGFSLLFAAGKGRSHLLGQNILQSLSHLSMAGLTFHGSYSMYKNTL